MILSKIIVYLIFCDGKWHNPYTCLVPEPHLSYNAWSSALWPAGHCSLTLHVIIGSGPGHLLLWPIGCPIVYLQGTSRDLGRFMVHVCVAGGCCSCCVSLRHFT